jgi:hypothetical protein
MHIWVCECELRDSNIKQMLTTMRRASSILIASVLSLFINLTTVDLAQLHSMAVDFPKTGESTSDSGAFLLIVRGHHPKETSSSSLA